MKYNTSYSKYFHHVNHFHQKKLKLDLEGKVENLPNAHNHSSSTTVLIVSKATVKIRGKTTIAVPKRSICFSVR